MKITLNPQGGKPPITVTRQGDALTINGEVFDFGPLEDGDVLPAEATGSDYFTDHISRKNGQIEVSLILPFGPNAPHETRFPEPITLTEDGPVTLPPYDAPDGGLLDD